MKTQVNKYIKQYDGIYNSFWVNKLTNTFIKKGKKKLLVKHINYCLILIKLKSQANPLIYLFEILDNIKPLFKLANVFPGKTAIIYPQVVSFNKQYLIALKWIKILILENKVNNRQITKFYLDLINNLELVSSTKSNLLIRKRDQYHLDAIKLQENIRYTWNINI